MRFLLPLFLTTAALLLAIAALNHRMDPTGLRALQQADRSPACAAGIRTDRRWTLPLLAGLGPAEAIVLGTSRSYRGFSEAMARDFFATPAVMNLGLPAMKAGELPDLVSAALRRGTVRQALLGIHYGMFAYPSETRPPDRHSRWLPTTLRDHARAYLSLHATRTSLDLLRGRCRPPLWLPSGFASGRQQRANRFFAAPDALGFIHPQEVLLDRRLQGGLDPADYSRGLAAFEDALARGCRHDLRWWIYIDPVHQRLQDILQRHGRQADLRQWQHDVTRIAGAWQARGCRLTLTDFSHGHPLLNSPFTQADGRYGSNAHFFEPTHFTPRLGQCLLNRLRDQPHDCPQPFGRPLVEAGPAAAGPVH